MFRSLGIASDVMVAGDDMQVEPGPDHIILRSPGAPAYWYGNCIVLREFDPDPSRAVALFRAQFPDAAHVCLQWDIPDPSADISAYVAQGLEPDLADTLLLEHLLPSPLPAGLKMRQIESDADWQQVIALQHRIGVQEDGHPEATHMTYIRDRFQAHRRAVHAGRATWFGAFDGARLVADMGLYRSAGLARFQSVETHPDYRRRGICAGLLSAVTAQAALASSRVVIVADRDGEAGRIYRRCGFALHETTMAAVTPGY